MDNKFCDLCKYGNEAYQDEDGKWLHTIKASPAELTVGFEDYEVSCLEKNES